MSEPRTAADAAAWIASEFYADEGMAKLLALAELGAAWAEAEAALPDGWWLVVSSSLAGGYTATANRPWRIEDTIAANGPTPAAALRALAAHAERGSRSHARMSRVEEDFRA